MIRILVIFLILFYRVEALTSEGKILFKSHAVSTEKELKLGDLVDFINIADSEKNYLSQIVLGNAPKFGETRTYTSKNLAEIVRTHLKDTASNKNVQVQIPNKIVVRGSGKTISEKEIKEELIHSMKAQCQECEIKIESLVVPKIPMISPLAKWSIGSEARRVRGPFQVKLHIKGESDFDKYYWINGKVAFYRKIPVAKRNLSNGERVSEEDFTFESKDVTYMLDSPPTKKDLLSSVVRGSLGVGQPILRSSLAKPLALVRGQTVSVLSGANGLKVTLRAIANENGYVGDWVKVTNPETKKVLTGQVIGEGEVELK